MIIMISPAHKEIGRLDISMKIRFGVNKFNPVNLIAGRSNSLVKVRQSRVDAKNSDTIWMQKPYHLIRKHENGFQRQFLTTNLK